MNSAQYGHFFVSPDLSLFAASLSEEKKVIKRPMGPNSTPSAKPPQPLFPLPLAIIAPTIPRQIHIIIYIIPIVFGLNSCRCAAGQLTQIPCDDSFKGNKQVIPRGSWSELTGKGLSTKLRVLGNSNEYIYTRGENKISGGAQRSKSSRSLGWIPKPIARSATVAIVGLTVPLSYF